MRHIGAVALAAVLAVAGCTGGDDDAAPAPRPGDGFDLDEPGDPLDLELVAFDDDTPVSIGDYAGRPLVVNFFGSWCPPCVREMPAIEAVKQDLGDEVAFLGIATRDRIEEARELVEDTGITWDLARDPLGDAAADLGVIQMPTTYLISPDGEVVEQHTGEVSEEQLRDLIADHFGVGA